MRHISRLKQENNKDKIIKLLSQGPTSKEIMDIYDMMGFDYGFKYVSREILQDGIRYARDMRDRYTVSHMLWDLRLLDTFSQFIIDEYEANGKLK